MQKIQGEIVMQQYTGKGSLSGFSSTTGFDPGEIAEEVYGDKFDYGHACAYLLRRFGFHFCGHDDYKELASWILTTPMDGVYLWVSIRGHSHTSCCFGICFSEEINKKFRMLQGMPWCVKTADAKRLAMENGYPFATMMTRKWNRRDMQAIRIYEKQQGLLHKKWDDFSEEEQKCIYDKLRNEMDNRLSQAWDDLEKCGYINPAEKAFNNFCEELRTALREAMKELLKPVHVRDCYINLLGQCKDKDFPTCEHCSKYDKDEGCDDFGTCDKFAQPHKYAGMGVERFVEAFKKDEEQE
jgi:hypothetical protein